MKDNERILNLADKLYDEISRMCHANNLDELDAMHLHAGINLDKLWDTIYEARFKVEDET